MNELFKCNEVEVVLEYMHLKITAESCGLNFQAKDNIFQIPDCPASNGIITFRDLREAKQFIYGYEMHYRFALESKK